MAGNAVTQQSCVDAVERPVAALVVVRRIDHRTPHAVYVRPRRTGRGPIPEIVGRRTLGACGADRQKCEKRDRLPEDACESLTPTRLRVRPMQDRSVPPIRPRGACRNRRPWKHYLGPGRSRIHDSYGSPRCQRQARVTSKRSGPEGKGSHSRTSSKPSFTRSTALPVTSRRGAKPKEAEMRNRNAVGLAGRALPIVPATGSL